MFLVILQFVVVVAAAAAAAVVVVVVVVKVVVVVVVKVVGDGESGTSHDILPPLYQALSEDEYFRPTVDCPLFLR